LGALPELVAGLLRPAAYDHPVAHLAYIETHISWVILTGEFAYKLKKPLDLGFLDFSTLDKRHAACEEELRLNRRLAADYYLAVVPITGTPAAPRVDGPGAALDYAVKMRQFPPDATLDRLDAAGQLTAQHVEAIATTLAHFHRTGCARADAASPWGEPDAIWQPVAQNFAQIAPHLRDDDAAARLSRLAEWSAAEHARLAPLMAQRKRDGYVRECHGDLHLGNLAWVDGRLVVFDCIEFNPALRWIDIMSEVAFCFMDLVHRAHQDWAFLFLNLWLEGTGDYAGLALLRYYAVYRALVRAKVALLRAAQAPGDTGAALAYLDLAAQLCRVPALTLSITHGLSGSGKTTATRRLIERDHAVRMRSDVERKRLAGLDALAKSGSAIGSGLYGSDQTQRTYAHLAQLADAVLAAGWPVIVDATFSKRWQRALFRDLARRRGVPFRILDFDLPVAILAERVAQRARAGGDASEADLAVLARQIATQEPLDDTERQDVVDGLGDAPFPSSQSGF
jgi:aminoglycoside phosphotransferase family enzyme/predicted kinase